MTELWRIYGVLLRAAGWGKGLEAGVFYYTIKIWILNRFNAVLIVWCDSVQLLFVVFKILELKVGCLRNYFAIDM